MLRVSHLIHDYSPVSGGGEAQVVIDWCAEETHVEHSIGLKKFETIDWVILHGIYKPHLLIMLLMSKLMGKKCGVFLHGGTLYTRHFSSSKLRNFYTNIVLLVLRLANVVIWVTSVQEYDSVKKFNPKARTVHFGLTQKETLYFDRVNRGVDLNDYCIKFLFVGRIAKVKRLTPFISAFASQLAENIHLKIVGPLEEGVELPKLVERDNRIDYIGAVEKDKLPEIFADCDVYVQPSVSENYSFTTRTAILMGKTCILGKINPWVDLIKSSSILVLPDKPVDWSAYLEHVISHISNNDLATTSTDIVDLRIPKWSEYSTYLNLE